MPLEYMLLGKKIKHKGQHSTCFVEHVRAFLRPCLPTFLFQGCAVAWPTMDMAGSSMEARARLVKEASVGASSNYHCCAPLSSPSVNMDTDLILPSPPRLMPRHVARQVDRPSI